MNTIQNKAQQRPLPFWLFCQLLSLIGILCVKVLLPNVDPFLIIIIYCLLGALLSYFIFRLQRWWVLSSILFPLLFVLLTTQFHYSNNLFLFAFIIIALFFSNVLKERVPLYLTNKLTHEALSHFANQQNTKVAIDLGCGFGGVVRSLATNSRKSLGVETAPLAWLVASLLSRLTGRGQIIRQDIWKTPLNEIDLAYCFLSPIPMPQVYEKAKKEMTKGSFLISNSFEVPNVKPFEVWELSDSRKTKLFIYKL